MTTIALLNPNSLVGKEIQEKLQQTEESWWDELRLLTTDSEVAGTLTQVRGSAELVQLLAADSLEGVDLLLDASPEGTDIKTLGAASNHRTSVRYAPFQDSEQGIPVVAGANLEIASRGAVHISPHPGVVALALILQALEPYGVDSASATIIQPVSMLGEGAMDELFAQAHSILTFSDDMPKEILGSQLVFNLTSVSADSNREMDRQLGIILGLESSVSVQLVQGGFFHGVGISLQVSLRETLEVSLLRSTLEKSAHLVVVQHPDSPLGPASVVGSEELLLTDLRAVEGQDNSFWLWGALDNLTRGSASNMVEISAYLMSANGH